MIRLGAVGGPKSSTCRSSYRSQFRAALHLLAFALLALTLSGCDKLVEGLVDLFLGVIIFAAVAVINLLSLIGIGVSGGLHSNGKRSWPVIVFSSLVVLACGLILGGAYGEMHGKTFAGYLLYGTLLPVGWFVGTIVSPLTVRRGLEDDPTPAVRRNVGVAGGLVLGGWFVFVGIKGGSLKMFYNLPDTPAQAKVPVIIEALHIGDGQGCAQTNKGIFCWPEISRLALSGDFAMWGAQACVGDLDRIVCRDLKTKKTSLTIPHRAHRILELGPGGGCMGLWETSKTPYVGRLAKRPTSLTAARACGRSPSARIRRAPRSTLATSLVGTCRRSMQRLRPWSDLRELKM